MGCLFGISIECSSHVALIGGYLGEIIAMLMPDLNESLTCTSPRCPSFVAVHR